MMKSYEDADSALRKCLALAPNHPGAPIKLSMLQSKGLIPAGARALHFSYIHPHLLSHSLNTFCVRKLRLCFLCGYDLSSHAGEMHMRSVCEPRLSVSRWALTRTDLTCSSISSSSSSSCFFFSVCCC